MGKFWEKETWSSAARHSGATKVFDKAVDIVDDIGESIGGSAWRHGVQQPIEKISNDPADALKYAIGILPAAAEWAGTALEGTWAGDVIEDAGYELDDLWWQAPATALSVVALGGAAGGGAMAGTGSGIGVGEAMLWSGGLQVAGSYLQGREAAKAQESANKTNILLAREEMAWQREQYAINASRDASIRRREMLLQQELNEQQRKEDFGRELFMYAIRHKAGGGDITDEGVSALAQLLAS